MLQFQIETSRCPTHYRIELAFKTTFGAAGRLSDFGIATGSTENWTVTLPAYVVSPFADWPFRRRKTLQLQTPHVAETPAPSSK
jgi:hypothetical protein